MPSKKGTCRTHPKAGPACRRCLLDHLADFRTANLRAGIGMAVERIIRLRAKFLSSNGTQVRPVDVSAALTGLLGELEAARAKVGDLPRDRSQMLTASNQARAGLS